MKVSENRKTHIFLIALVLTVLVLPTIGAILKLDLAAPRAENRARAQFPTLPKTAKEIPKTISAFDAYYADSFGFRNILIKLYSMIKYFVFHASPSDRVVLGKDGWLFLARQTNIEAYRNLKPFTVEELEAFTKKIAERNAWAEKQGAQYIYMVGPDSHTLNSEYLPGWATKVNPGSRLDQLIQYAKSKYNIDILDVRPSLFEGKKTGLVSYKTDTHWNGFGGYLAYREVIKRIKTRYPEVGEPAPETDYKLVATNHEGMDMALMFGLTDLIHEVGQDYIYLGNKAYEHTELEGLHFTSVNKGVPEFPVAFVCDSMGGNLEPGLSRHFSKVRVLWGYPFDSAEILRYKPKVIIHLVIERTLVWDQLANPKEVQEALLTK